jgi:hypothetical protein
MLSLGEPRFSIDLLIVDRLEKLQKLTVLDVTLEIECLSMSFFEGLLCKVAFRVSLTMLLI